MSEVSVTTGKRRRGRGRREEILRIAGELIAEKGYANATVRDIADAAGIQSGSLYRHFDSKESILEDLLRTYLDGLIVDYEAVLAKATSSTDALRGLIGVACRVVQKHRMEVTILHDSYKHFERTQRFSFVAVMHRQIMNFWLNVLDEGRANGEFRRDVDSRIASRAIMGGIETTVRWFDERGAFTIDQIAEQHQAIYLAGLVSTPAPEVA